MQIRYAETAQSHSFVIDVEDIRIIAAVALSTLKKLYLNLLQF